MPRSANIALKAGPPLPIRTAHLLSSLGRLQSRRFTDGLEPLGVRAKQFALLNHIALAEGTSQKEIGRRMGLDPSGLVATLDELQRRGLVERRPHETDRRRYALHLTKEGRKKLAEGRAVAQDAAGRLLAPLSHDEISHLHDLLERLAAEDQPHPSSAAA
jgi:MarR family transcriptional regulator, lower aerobic nicotinate degradation pathway regulator